MILIAYDGSEQSDRAIRHAAELLPGSSATVLTVWEPVSRFIVMAPNAYGALTRMNAPRVEEARAASAEDVAEQGAELARSCGLDASARTRSGGESISDEILDEAERVGARAIVVGTRGRGGLGTLLLGSVSHAVLQHADRPVLVVPSDAVSEHRAARRRERLNAAEG